MAVTKSNKMQKQRHYESMYIIHEKSIHKNYNFLQFLVIYKIVF